MRHRQVSSVSGPLRLTSGIAIAVIGSLGVSMTAAEASSTVASASDTSAMSVMGTPVQATPVTPAAMSAADLREPTVLYHEDFENTGTGALPTLLSDYRAEAPGVAYTADAYWSDPKYCNGFITSYDTALDDNRIFSTYCGQNGDSTGGGQGDYMAVRTKAYELGLHANSANPGSNRALSTNTSGGTPTNVMFRTVGEDIQISADAGDVSTRYVAFSVDGADTTGTNDPRPRMRFSLLQGGKEIELNSQDFPGNIGNPFNHYQKNGFTNFPQWASVGRVGTYYSEPFTIDASTKVGLVVRNFATSSSTGCGAYYAPGSCSDTINGQPNPYKGSANGNDGAIDNIRILDVTPTMVKSFTPAAQSVGQTSTMVLTVHNRADLEAKVGWGFVDTLPEGLVFASDTVTHTCGATSVVADTVKQTLTVTNGHLPKGQETCTISVEVTATTPGSYTNGNPNGNFSDKQYIDGPENATVTFYSGSVSWDKVDADGGALLSGSEWVLTGPGAATASQPEGGWPVGTVVDCEAASAADCDGLDQNPATGKFTVTGLPAGVYTLTEQTPPPGYEATTQTFTAEITDTQQDVHFGDKGTITNKKIPGAVNWRKVDPDGQTLAHAEWKIVGPAPLDTERVVEDCVGPNTPSAAVCAVDTDRRPGYFSVSGFAPGTYDLIETQAPAGYVALTESITVTIEMSEGTPTVVDLPDIVNNPREAPALPLSGGVGRDLFVILGGGVLALGIGAAIALQRRRRKLHVTP